MDGDFSHAQRLGYLIDKFGKKNSTSELHKWLTNMETKFVPPHPGWDGKISARDEKWRVLVNDDVEPDQ